MGKSENIWFLKTNDQKKTFSAYVVMTNGFALNHDKSLQIYFCVKLQTKNDFLKDVKSTVGIWQVLLKSLLGHGFKTSKSTQQRFGSWLNIQADPSFCWAHMFEGTFSHFTVHNYITLDTHYEKNAYSNILKILQPKKENFQIKNSDIFHIPVQNIDCGYLLEPPQWGGSNEYPQYMLLSKNKKNNVYPCKPQFYYIKVGFKGGVKNI